MNKRRKLVIALGAGAVAAPLGLFAQQQAKVWRVGFLSPRSRPASFDSDDLGAFLQGMRDLGYAEGNNLVIEWRFAGGKYERLSELAAELVQLKVHAIVATSAAASKALQQATTTAPIIMAIVDEPVRLGLIKSLAHPGGNITGTASLGGALESKRLEMLLEMAPKLSRVAAVMNPANPNHATRLQDIQAAARKLNVTIVPVAVRTVQEFSNAFSLMNREKVQAFIGLQDALTNTREIAELAARHRLPSISGSRAYADAGGLMSYGLSSTEILKRTAAYVDKIFKGAKPADLPVEQPTKFELIINGTTTKALGLKIPQSLLVMADKVIE